MSGWVLLYARGLATTVELLLLSCALGHTLAIPIAVATLSRRPVWRYPARAYVYFLRGSPLLVQLFLIYHGLPQLHALFRSTLWLVIGSPFWCAAIAFSLNTSAYTAELFAGAIRAMNPGEIEAATALGMPPLLRLRRIVLPSALRRALPAYGNEAILLLHGTALAGAVTVIDLAEAARVVSTRTYAFIESYAAAALLYGTLVLLLSTLFRALERRWLAYLAPAQSEPAEPRPGLSTPASN